MCPGDPFSESSKRHGRHGRFFGKCLVADGGILGRQVHILAPTTNDSEEEPLDADTTAIIRHAGWITSCLLALVIHVATLACRNNNTTSPKDRVKNDDATGTDVVVSAKLDPSSWQTLLMWTAYATALEALATDLWQLTPTPATSGVFYCGNFGLIILNPLWLHHPDERGNCHSVLSILKDMIRTTMMRGAQSGGVVTFEPTTSRSSSSMTVTMKATRSRVVNRKRTDLSERIIAQVQHDNRRAFRSGTQQVKTFSGHTRFATTSIANFDGTHPHRWSPRGMRTVHDFATGTTTLVGVENYIMHNGTNVL